MPKHKITPESVGADQTSREEVNTEKKTPVDKKIEYLQNEIKRLNKLLENQPVETTTKDPAADLALQKANINNVIKSQKQAIIDKLNKQPQVQIMIPLGIGEKPGDAKHEVGINGVVLVYPKGKMLTVPESVAKLIADHFSITFSAGEAFRIDRDKKVQDALG